MDLFEKCVSFTGDNCNTNFGGLARRKGHNVFSRLKNDVPNLVGIGCPAHILNNCLHHGTNQMSIDIESIIYKTYQQARSQDLKKGGGYFERVRSVHTTLTRIFIDLESVSDGLSEI